MMVSKYIRIDDDKKIAAEEWYDENKNDEDHMKVTEKYGNISKWNTSLVTNMTDQYDRAIFGYESL